MKKYWLIIFIEKEPRLDIVQSTRESLFSKGNKHYKIATPVSGSIGHYDWLRNFANRIVGVRYWPFCDLEQMNVVVELVRRCRSYSYIKADSDLKNVSILFDTSEINEQISNDQDLGDNGIYITPDGEYAFCFEFYSEHLRAITPLLS